MVNNEQVKNEEQVNKPHGNLNSRQSIPPKEQDKPKSIKMIGKVSNCPLMLTSTK